MTDSFYFPLLLPNIGRIINMQAEIDIFVVLGHRWLGGNFESHQCSDALFYITSFTKGGLGSMEQFVVDFFGRVGSSMLATYLIRLVDKFLHKNNRQCK